MRGRTPLLIILVVLVLILGGAYYYITTQNNNNNAASSTTPVASNGTPGSAGPAVTIIPPTPIRLTLVVIALQDLPRGYKIPAYDPNSSNNAIDTAAFPQDNTPALAVTVQDPNSATSRLAALNQVAGQIARTDIPRGSAILTTQIVSTLDQISATGSDAAALVPPGTRAITVPIDRTSALGYAIRDGDYVDVIGTFVYTDVDPSFQSALPNKTYIVSITASQSGGGNTLTFLGLPSGRLNPVNLALVGPVLEAIVPSESQRPRLTTQTIVQHALVIHVGTFPLQGSFIGQTPTAVAPTAAPADQSGGSSSSSSNATVAPSPTPPLPDIMTIAVSPQEANVLAWMLDSHVPLTYTLHDPNLADPNNPATAGTSSVTLSYMVTHYGVAEPVGLPFGLEPPLRSIRSLTSSTLIPLSAPYGNGQAAVGTGG